MKTDTSKYYGENGIHRVPLWRIGGFALNNSATNLYLFFMGYVAYYLTGFVGIAVVMASSFSMIMRLWDGVTDPFIGFVVDKTNGRFGKNRPFIVIGQVILCISSFILFHVTHKLPENTAIRFTFFIIFSMIYYVGYTFQCVVTKSAQSCMTNDPKQRPLIGVWTTAFNYLVPMTMMIVLNMVLLPMFGGQYNQAFLSAACWVCIGMGAVGIVLVCIGVSAFDKPENFTGVSKKREPLKIKDMASVLKGNRPLQCYIVAQATDKLATQTNSQAVINTLLFGIVIGNMGIATTLQAVSMLPSILFAIVGAKYAGKFGSKKTIVTWSTICMVIAAVTILFFAVGDPRQIAVMGPMMILYIILNLSLSGSMMCITTASNAFMADVIDYELDRSGKYVPAVVTGVYSLIDKIISAFGAVIATSCVAVIGYTTSLPQPGDEMTTALFWMTMFVKFGLPILGWLATLAAMRFCKLDKAEMVEVQKRIADKKAAARHQVIEENLK